MILVTSRFRVANGLEESVRLAFVERPCSVESAEGFLGLEVYVDASDPTEFHLVTRWLDTATFEAWHGSPAHKRSHVGIPKGLKLDAGRTEIRVLDRIDGANPASISLALDASLLLAPVVEQATGLLLFVADRDGRVQRCNEAAATCLGARQEEIVGRPLWERLVPEHSERLRALLRDGVRKPEQRHLFNFRDARGDPFSLYCQLDFHGDRVILVGERPWADVARLSEELTQSNNQLSAVTRENIRQARQLKHTLAELEERNAKLQEAYARIEELARTDPLTGLYNRREFQQRLSMELARTRREDASTGVAIIDLDHFKAINDTYGHPVGDLVLVAVARAMEESARSYDTLARYGGEEFVVLLPGTAEPELCMVAERLRLAIAGTHGCEREVTASIGAAVARKGETAESLLERADAALYRAKDGGRDRVEIAE